MVLKHAFSLLITILFVFTFTADSQAGLFSSEPPDEWGKMPIVFNTSKGYLGQGYKLKDGRIRFLRFGEFITHLKSGGKADFDWREGKADGKWILDVASTNENTNKKHMTNFVFQQIVTPKGTYVVWLNSVYIDGNSMGDGFCRMMVESMYKEFAASIKAKAGKK